MPCSDDVDAEALISRLAGPLPPYAAAAFRRAAEAALAQIQCPGEGVCYRAIAALQRAFWDPPDDRRAGWDVSQDLRASKLANAPPLKDGRDLRFSRFVLTG